MKLHTRLAAVATLTAATFATMTAAAASGPARAEAVLPVVTVTADADAEWHSYRHAYKAARFFAPHVASRPLIQAHMQIRPLSPDAPMDGLRVQLVGEKTNVEIAVDALGRVTLPMLKQAFDEDAVLRLNRRKGHYQFNGRYSIREREDGVYPAAMLREACEQLISAQRASGYRLRLIGKQCAGIKFIFAPGEAAAGIDVRTAAGSRRVEAQAGLPFENRSMGNYQVATYRFADWPETGAVLPDRKLLGIGTLYE